MVPGWLARAWGSDRADWSSRIWRLSNTLTLEGVCQVTRSSRVAVTTTSVGGGVVLVAADGAANSRGVAHPMNIMRISRRIRVECMLWSSPVV